MQDNGVLFKGCAQLARAYRLDRTAAHPLLGGPQGVVPLNHAAAAILALCDGTHTAAQIAGDAAGNVQEGLADDVRAFLDAARRRGWITVG